MCLNKLFWNCLTVQVDSDPRWSTPRWRHFFLDWNKWTTLTTTIDQFMNYIKTFYFHSQLADINNTFLLIGACFFFNSFWNLLFIICPANRLLLSTVHYRPPLCAFVLGRSQIKCTSMACLVAEFCLAFVGFSFNRKLPAIINGNVTRLPASTQHFFLLCNTSLTVKSDNRWDVI